MNNKKHTIQWLCAVLLAAALVLTGCAGGESEAPAPVEETQISASVTMGETEYTGTYTGWALSGVPQGEGRFEGETGLIFTGSFDKGAMLEGQGENLPLTLEWNGIHYTGLYTGAVADGLPQGEGLFTGESATGLDLALSGGWEAGLPQGEGSVRAELCTTLWNGAERPGPYEGETLHGIPHGEGRFSGADEQGSFTYTGQWEDGLFHGEGTLSYEGDSFFLRRGTFTQGQYTPDYVQLVEALGSCEPRFTLTEEQREFIPQFPGLWEAEADRFDFSGSEFKAVYERNFYPQLLFRQPEDFATSWLRLESLRYIDSMTLSLGEDLTVTRITAANSMYTMTYQCYLLGELPTTPRYLSRMHVYAIPVALSQYTNTLGADVPCAVLLVGDIRI